MHVHWDLIERDRQGLLPVMEHLTRHFGTKWALEHLGGGCTAMAATFEGGLLVWLTNAGDDACQATPGGIGWAVGVYDALDPGDPLYVGDHPLCAHDGKTAALLVQAALDVVKGVNA